MILIVSIPDICVLPYFLYSHEYQLTRNTVYCAILSDQIVAGCTLGVPISYCKELSNVYTVLKIVVYVTYCHTNNKMMVYTKHDVEYSLSHLNFNIMVKYDV